MHVFILFLSLTKFKPLKYILCYSMSSRRNDLNLCLTHTCSFYVHCGILCSRQLENNSQLNLKSEFIPKLNIYTFAVTLSNNLRTLHSASMQPSSILHNQRHGDFQLIREYCRNSNCEKGITFKLVPQNQHRWIAAEYIINVFKN